MSDITQEQRREMVAGELRVAGLQLKHARWLRQEGEDEAADAHDAIAAFHETRADLIRRGITLGNQHGQTVP